MLQIVNPIPFILTPIHIKISTKTVSFIIFPLTRENIPIHMVECTPPMRFILKPLSVIFGTIRPRLLPLAMFKPIPELTRVHNTILEFVSTLLEVLVRQI